jgi:hypothetical protein
VIVEIFLAKISATLVIMFKSHGHNINLLLLFCFSAEALGVAPDVAPAV